MACDNERKYLITRFDRKNGQVFFYVYEWDIKVPVTFFRGNLVKDWKRIGEANTYEEASAIVNKVEGEIIVSTKSIELKFND